MPAFCCGSCLPSCGDGEIGLVPKVKAMLLLKKELLDSRNSLPVKIPKFCQKEQAEFTKQKTTKMHPSARFYTLKYFNSLFMRGSAI